MLPLSEMAVLITLPIIKIRIIFRLVLLCIHYSAAKLVFS